MGGYLALARSVHSPSMDEAAARWNASDATPQQLEAFLDGLEFLEPGVVSLPKWRPEPETGFRDRDIFQYGGVGRKP